MSLSGSWTKLDMPALPEDHRLRSVLGPLLRRRFEATSASNLQSRLFWDASFFSLPKSRLYRDTSVEQQRAILADCNHQILEEAYSIEKAGMAYAAKMSLLADSLEERMIYSLFAADEATHFHGIQLFLGRDVDEQEQPFLSFLSQFIDRGEKSTLLFTIQVILEGWGLSHYRKLAESCQCTELQSFLQFILRDEASHHGSGLILSEESAWSKETARDIAETLTVFLNMVRCGPLGVLGAFERVLGGLSPEQKKELLRDLESESQSMQRLDLLKGLMKSRPGLVDQLTSRDCFRPMSPEESVQWA